MKIVIKVGGSLCIGPDGPNYSYLSKLLPVLNHVRKQHQLIVLTGGGQLVRKYFKSINKFRLSPEEMEWIAVDLFRVNARFLSSLLKCKLAYSPEELDKNFSGVLCGGVSPGRSSDSTAAIAAAKIHADLLIKLTNVHGIYNKDPNRVKNARLICNMGFHDLRKFEISGKPGNYGILDKMAIETIVKNRIRTVVMSGRNPKALLALLEGQHPGTLIS